MLHNYLIALWGGLIEWHLKRTSTYCTSVTTQAVFKLTSPKCRLTVREFIIATSIFLAPTSFALLAIIVSSMGSHGLEPSTCPLTPLTMKHSSYPLTEQNYRITDLFAQLSIASRTLSRAPFGCSPSELPQRYTPSLEGSTSETENNCIYRALRKVKMHTAVHFSKRPRPRNMEGASHV